MPLITRFLLVLVVLVLIELAILRLGAWIGETDYKNSLTKRTGIGRVKYNDKVIILHPDKNEQKDRIYRVDYVEQPTQTVGLVWSKNLIEKEEITVDASNIQKVEIK